MCCMCEMPYMLCWQPAGIKQMNAYAVLVGKRQASKRSQQWSTLPVHAAKGRLCLCLCAGLSRTLSCSKKVRFNWWQAGSPPVAPGGPAVELATPVDWGGMWVALDISCIKCCVPTAAQNIPQVRKDAKDIGSQEANMPRTTRCRRIMHD